MYMYEAYRNAHTIQFGKSNSGMHIYFKDKSLGDNSFNIESSKGSASMVQSI